MREMGEKDEAGKKEKEALQKFFVILGLLLFVHVCYLRVMGISGF
jgi:hypothetical protein